MNTLIGILNGPSDTLAYRVREPSILCVEVNGQSPRFTPMDPGRWEVSGEQVATCANPWPVRLTMLDRKQEFFAESCLPTFLPALDDAWKRVRDAGPSEPFDRLIELVRDVVVAEVSPGLRNHPDPEFVARAPITLAMCVDVWVRLKRKEMRADC